MPLLPTLCVCEKVDCHQFWKTSQRANDPSVIVQHVIKNRLDEITQERDNQFYTCLFFLYSYSILLVILYLYQGMKRGCHEGGVTTFKPFSVLMHQV